MIDYELEHLRLKSFAARHGLLCLEGIVVVKNKIIGHLALSDESYQAATDLAGDRFLRVDVNDLEVLEDLGLIEINTNTGSLMIYLVHV